MVKYHYYYDINTKKWTIYGNGYLTLYYNWYKNKKVSCLKLYMYMLENFKVDHWRWNNEVNINKEPQKKLYGWLVFFNIDHPCILLDNKI